MKGGCSARRVGLGETQGSACLASVHSAQPWGFQGTPEACLSPWVSFSRPHSKCLCSALPTRLPFLTPAYPSPVPQAGLGSPLLAPSPHAGPHPPNTKLQVAPRMSLMCLLIDWKAHRSHSSWRRCFSS